MNHYHFEDPRSGFRALIAAPTEARAELRAALVNLSLLGNREGAREPASLRPHHGPLPHGIAIFHDEFFAPMERQLTALLERCGLH